MDDHKRKWSEKFRERKRKRLRRLKIDLLERNEEEDYVNVHDRSTVLDIRTLENKSARCHFLKNVFTPSEMKELQDALFAANYWESGDCKQGRRAIAYSGHWNAQAHFDPDFDQPYGAGIGRKVEERLENPILQGILESLGQKVSGQLRKYRKDIVIPLEEERLENLDFGFFHLFMCACGASLPHTVDNDFVSCAFVVNIGKKTVGGGIDFPDLKLSLNLRVGDLLIMDSDVISHGSFRYQGSEDPINPTLDDRLVGLFVIHRSYLKLLGFKREFDLGREDFDTRTIPDCECLHPIETDEVFGEEVIDLTEPLEPKKKKRKKKPKNERHQKQQRKQFSSATTWMEKTNPVTPSFVLTKMFGQTFSLMFKINL